MGLNLGIWVCLGGFGSGGYGCIGVVVISCFWAFGGVGFLGLGLKK